MTSSSDHPQDQHTPRHQEADSMLPLTVRQRLWEQLWTRLLAPPVDPGDRAPSPRPHARQDGGPQ
jgi:hypothetical protein